MCRFIVAVVIAIVSLFNTVGAKTFHDVNSDEWYYDYIQEAVNSGLLEGYPNGAFEPYLPVSYAEFTSIVSRVRELSPAYGQTEHWAANTMLAALNAKWYDWDEIPPTGELYNSPIPRKIAAKILANAVIPDIKGSYSSWSTVIADFNSLGGRYYEPVFALYESGLVTGDSQGNFNPNKSLTRAEACTLIVKAAANSTYEAKRNVNITENEEAVTGGVAENGHLKVLGTQLCAENGTPVVLRGMSSHGIHWYGNYASKESIKGTRDYGANVFRVAMYTGEGGYIYESSIKNTVFKAIDSAVSLDMYAVLDWHILSDGNPLTHKEQAKIFFDEAAKRYGDNPAVIYEICNEPNGNVYWEKDIRPYGMKSIPIIRKHSPNAVILVGTGTWSQDVHDVSGNPLPFDNIMYTFHFYAGTHKDSLRNRVESALDSGTPIFVSEWGTNDASGSGGIYIDEAQIWLDFLDRYNISWINWSLCDKKESSAVLKPGTSAAGGWTEGDLTDSGMFVFNKFN